MQKLIFQLKRHYSGTMLAYLLVVLVSGAQGPEVLASAITPERVIELVNQDRLASGLSLLSQNDELTKAAEAKADDMVQYRYFAHTSPTGVTPWHWIEKTNYDYKHAGENLAIHFVSAEEEEQAWMQSPKHRENIVSPKYHDTGVAVRTMNWQGATSVVTVQMFGAASGIVLPATQDQPLIATQESEVPVFKTPVSLGGFEERVVNTEVTETIGNMEWIKNLSAYQLWLVAVLLSVESIGLILVVKIWQKEKYLTTHPMR